MQKGEVSQRVNCFLETSVRWSFVEGCCNPRTDAVTTCFECLSVFNAVAIEKIKSTILFYTFYRTKIRV